VFADTNLGAKIDLSVLEENDLIKVLFQKILVVFQAKEDSILESKLKADNVTYFKIGTVTNSEKWILDI
jgi:phosphoribosylformylglycinamidine synthase